MSELNGLTPNALLDSRTPLFFTSASADEARTRMTSSRYWAEVSVYEWTPRTGMWRISPQAGAVPGTLSALSAIGYIASVRTDSIFILREMDAILSSQGLQMALLGALTLRSAALRRVILPLDEAKVPSDLLQISADLGELLVPLGPAPLLAAVHE